MNVIRIVTNIATDDVSKARAFYGTFLGLDIIMDLGWILSFGSGEVSQAQISVASEGGSGANVPDISIEVDDVDEAHRRAVSAGIEIVYGLTDEPWGVRRFYVQDPFGKLVNILAHSQ